MTYTLSKKQLEFVRDIIMQDYTCKQNLRCAVGGIQDLINSLSQEKIMFHYFEPDMVTVNEETLYAKAGINE